MKNRIIKNTLKAFTVLLTCGLAFTSTVAVPVYAAEDRYTEMMSLLDQIITAETEYGLSGVQLAVMKDGKLVKSSSYGNINNYKNVYDAQGKSIPNQIELLPENERIPVSEDTLFDLASNTKMYAAVYAVQKLVSEGALSLDTKIMDIFPEFIDFKGGIPSRDKVTVENLLLHNAGFVPDPQYHNNNYDKNEGSTTGSNHLFSQEKSKTFEMMMITPLMSEPGTKVNYSDVDFMLLGEVVEKITGKSLDAYVSESFYKPLGLHNISFNPLDNGFDSSKLSSSELHGNSRDGRINFINNRTEIISGQVHDEKAYYAMDGVSGHAGLFGSAKDIASLANLMLEGGTRNGVEYFNQATIDTFTTAGPNSGTYARGWRKNGNGGYRSIFSPFASNETFGHTGWTGTLTEIDPTNNLVLVMNTNSRNSPIMGPGDNDFYTKNLNTNTYGMVPSLVYQAFGLGDGLTANQILINMVNAEASATSQLTPSGRNALRALLSVVRERAPFDAELFNYLTSEEVQAMIGKLEPSFKEDTKYATVTEETNKVELTKKVNEVQLKDLSLYTSTSVTNLQFSLDQANEVLANRQSSQGKIDDALAKLIAADAALVLRNEVDLSKLNNALSEAKGIDASKYTESTYSALKAEIELSESFIKEVNNSTTQEEVDSRTNALQSATKDLVLKSTDEKVIVEPNGDATPNTGVTTFSLVQYALASMVGLCIAILVLKKKHETE